MKHLVRTLVNALRHPLVAAVGVREFRSDFTKSYDDWNLAESYDCGRELAHMVTFRKYDQTVY